MNVTAPKTVANITMPRLLELVQTRKQVRWQWKHSAAEHKHKWVLVLIEVDKSIDAGERILGDRLDIKGFRVKREVAE